MCDSAGPELTSPCIYFVGCLRHVEECAFKERGGGGGAKHVCIGYLPALKEALSINALHAQ